METRRFSHWERETGEAPGGAALVQIKVLGALLRYPEGQSAMVWYGVLEPCDASSLSLRLNALQSVYPERTLVWRALCTPSAEAELTRSLARFQARFGALPGRVASGGHEV